MPGIQQLMGEVIPCHRHLDTLDWYPARTAMTLALKNVRTLMFARSLAWNCAEGSGRGERARDGGSDARWDVHFDDGKGVRAVRHTTKVLHVVVVVRP